ncbi:hypothetical protein ABT116_25020, partial [Streptomyces sp. NPDC002130]
KTGTLTEGGMDVTELRPLQGADADLLAERRRRAAPDTGRPAELPLADHLELLRQAGFDKAGPVWQYGDSCVVVAVR